MNRPTAAFENARGRDGPCVALVEGDVGRAPRRPSFFCNTKSDAVEIDAEHRARRTDQLAHEKTDITQATANIQDVHAGADAGGTQHPLGERPKHLGLFDQSLVFGVGPAERVVGVVQPMLEARTCTSGVRISPSGCGARRLGFALTVGAQTAGPIVADVGRV